MQTKIPKLKECLVFSFEFQLTNAGINLKCCFTSE